MDSSYPEPEALPFPGRVSVPHNPGELLTTTRTVRRRLDRDRPVEKVLIRRALEVAAQAPTAGGTPRAHFVIVTGPGVPEAVALPVRGSVPHNPGERWTTSRTVRRRLDRDRPVEKVLIRRALEVAAQAPTGGGTPRAHFVIVTDPAVRETLGEVYGRVW